MCVYIWKGSVRSTGPRNISVPSRFAKTTGSLLGQQHQAHCLWREPHRCHHEYAVFVPLQFNSSPVYFSPEEFVFFIVIGSGLLYTFGGGHYGKLGLEEENFMNRFSPMLCTCFLKYNVEFVSIFFF